MTLKPSLRRVFWIVLLLTLILGGCDKKNDKDPQDPSGTLAGQGDSSDSGSGSLEAMQVIEGRVSELRDLETLAPVEKAFLTPDELRQRLEEDLFEDLTEEDLHDELLLYVALEFAEPDLDLYNLYLDLFTEQVAGFYDPDTEELYVTSGDEEAGAVERLTFAHEYAHVLQDQHFDLEALGFTDEGEDDEDSERSFAIRSLVEGDATLLQQQYLLQYFKLDDVQEMLDEIGETDMSVLDSAPTVIREFLMFPYEYGMTFVSVLFGEGGWAAVNAAYANPPVSTEQILHPNRYPGDVPQIITLPPLTDTLGAGWRLVDEDIMGEFGLRLYLDVHIGKSDAEDAAQGWGGDRYAVYWREDQSAFVLALRLGWDTSGDAAEFFEDYTRFAEDRFGDGPSRSEGDVRLWWFGDDALVLARNDQHETLVLIAPDEATLDAVHALFPGF